MKIPSGLFFVLKNLFFLLLYYNFASYTVLAWQNVQSQELLDIQNWKDFQTVDLVSVSAVADDCEKIFQSYRIDTQKIIEDMKLIVQSEQDTTAVPPKIWDSLTHLINTLQEAVIKVESQFSGIGQHYMKRLDGAISIAKYKKSVKFQEILDIYNGEIDSSNDFVITLEKTFSDAYNPTQLLQDTLRDSLNKDTYSSSSAEDEISQLQITTTQEIDNIENYAIKILNQMYKGIYIAKALQSTIRSTGAYPEQWDSEYIVNNLKICSFLSKTAQSLDKTGKKSVEKNEVDTSINTKEISNESSDKSVIDVDLNDDSDKDDVSGCGEIFRKTERRIMRQLVVAIKQIKSMKDAVEIDSRIFKIFKNYSVILGNLNHKIVTNLITVINQFFQLYNVVLSILDKINPGMREKVYDILFISDVDKGDSYYANINKFIVENYLSTTRINEFSQKIENDIKPMKSLSEIKNTIIQELSLTTNDLGKDIKNFKETLFYILEELQNSVTALQNIKRKSNRLGWRYYFNFYKGKADLAQLKKMMYIINAINIDLLVERELINDAEELQDFNELTQYILQEVNRENEKITNKLNRMEDYSFVEGFVSQSVLEYNLILKKYSSESRETLKRVITKYITIFEEITIIIKRKKIKNSNDLESLFTKEVSTYVEDEVITKYLLESSEADISTLCTSLNLENTLNKETVMKEIKELNQITSQEVNRINESVKRTIDAMTQHVEMLKSIKQKASQTTNYEITQEELNCFTKIIQLIDSLQIRSNNDEMQNLSIYFDRVIDKIQSAMQAFESKVSQISEITKLKTEVQSLESSIYDVLSTASSEMNTKITRFIFRYNEKFILLMKKTSIESLKEIQNAQIDDNFSLNDSTKKCITNSYNFFEMFTKVNSVFNSDQTDFSKIKTEVSSQLDETTDKIESEISTIQSDILGFARSLSEGIKIMEKNYSKKVQQVDETELNKLKEVTNMVQIISRYMLLSNENSKREIQIQVDQSRMQISREFENVSETLKSLTEQTEIENSVVESINTSEKIYNELDNRMLEIIHKNVDQFFATMQQTTDRLKEKSIDVTVLSKMFERNYSVQEDKDYQKYSLIMSGQDFRSSTVVSDAFNELKRKNNVDSASIKQKSDQLFQSLTDKIGLDMNNINFVSKFITKQLEDSSKILVRLEKSEVEVLKSLTQEEIVQLKKTVVMAHVWKTGSQNKVIREIETRVSEAKTMIESEFNQITSTVSTMNEEEESIQSQVHGGLQSIQTVYDNIQHNVTARIESSMSEFYDYAVDLSNDVEKLQNENFRSAIRDIMVGGNIEEIKNEIGEEYKNFDYSCFVSKKASQKVYDRLKIAMATDQESNLVQIVNTHMSQYSEEINQDFLKMQSTSKFLLENVQKTYDILREAQYSKSVDYQFTQSQINELKIFKVFYQTILNVSESTSEHTDIISQINDVRRQINEEYEKATTIIQSSQTNTEQLQIETVKKIDELYSTLNEKVKTELIKISSDFYGKFEKFTSESLFKQNIEIHSAVQNILNGRNYYEDQSYLEVSTFLNSGSFKSSLTVSNWFKEIHTTCSDSAVVIQQTLNELSVLNDRITTTMQSLETTVKYVMENTQTSSDLLSQINTTLEQDSTYQLTEDQINKLQSITATYQTLRSVTNVESSVISYIQSTITSDISKTRELINEEYSEITKTLSSVTDVSQVQFKTSRSVDKFEEWCVETKEKVQRQLNEVVTGFYNDFVQIISDSSQQELHELSSSLQSVLNGNIIHDIETDQNLSTVLLYFNSESFKSNVMVRNAYENIQITSTNESVAVNQKAINELKTLNEYTVKSLSNMEEISTSVLNMMTKSSEIVSNIKKSFKQSTQYQLTKEELLELQKSVVVQQTLKTMYVNSREILNTKCSISADISALRTSIQEQYTKITNSLSSLIEESQIQQIETESVIKIDKIYALYKQRLQTQILQTSFSLFSSFQQISSDMTKQNISVKSMLQEILSSKSAYEVENDQTFQNVISLFSSKSFQSSRTVQNWYEEIVEINESSGRLNVLNDRVMESLNSWEENSNYLIEVAQKSSSVLVNLQNLVKKNSNCEISEEEINQLQRTVAMYQTVMNSATSVSSVTLMNSQRSIELEITASKSLISNEYATIINKLNTVKEEKAVDELKIQSISKFNQYYSELKEKVQSKFLQITTTFYSNFNQILTDSRTRISYENISILQNVLIGKSSYEIENDQTFIEFTNYLGSFNFKSSTCVWNWYEEVKDTSNTSSQLNTINERLTQSVDQLQTNSQYIITTMKNGAQILRQFSESMSQNVNISQEQIVELQKCISVVQNIKKSSTYVSSTDIISIKQTITSDITTLKNHLTSEYSKTTSVLDTVTEEEKIKQVANESITKFEQYYSETRDRVQSQLSQITSNFFNNFDQLSIDTRRQFQSQSMVLRDVLNSKEICDMEDQSLVDAISYLKSSSFTSSTCIRNWSKEINSRSSETVIEKTSSELSILNEKITESLDQMQSQSEYVLNTIESGVQVMKQIRESIKTNSFEISQEQLTQFQKCVSVIETTTSVTSNMNSMTVTNVQQTITSEVEILKNQVNMEYKKVTAVLNVTSDLHTMRQIASESVDKFSQYYVETRDKVQFQLSHISSSFLSNFEQISSDFKVQTHSKSSSMLENILNSKETYEVEDDQSYIEAMSYLKSSSFVSSSCVQNWFTEVQSTNQKVVEEMNAFSNQITQSVNQMQSHSDYILNTIKSGVQVLKQVRETIKTSTNLELSQEQSYQLQKSVSLLQTIKTTTQTVNSITVMNTQQTITSDVNTLRSQLSTEYTNFNNVLSTITEEEVVKRVSSESVQKFNEYYTETRNKVQSQLSQISLNFYNNFDQMTTNTKVQIYSTSSTLQNILNSKETYEVEDDQAFIEAVSYLQSNDFTSSNCIQKWSQEVESVSEETLNQKVTRELSFLNERISQSVDQLETHSEFVLSSVKSGVQVLKQIKESTKTTDIEITEEQIVELKKCISIIQTVKSVAININSIAVRNTQQTISNDVNVLKKQISSEYTKATSVLNSSGNEENAKQLTNESVIKFNQYYTETRDKVQSQLSDISESFYRDFEQITFDSSLQTQNQSYNLLRSIFSSKDTYDVEDDKSYVEVISYLKSSAFTSNICVQNWFREVQSSETSESISQQMSNKLNTLNSKISQSVDQIQSNSEYVLNTIKSGIQVIKKIRKSTTNSNFELTQEQVIQLQKCNSIVQTIKTTCTNVNSLTVTSTQKIISSDVTSFKTQLSSEYTKVTSALSTVTNEEQIKQIASQSLTKFSQNYSETREKIQSQLSQITNSFFSNFEQFTIDIKLQSLSESTTMLQDILISKEIYGVEDQSYIEAVSYLKSSSFISSSCVQNWYREIESTTTSESVSEKISTEFSTLNEKIVQSVDQMQTQSDYVLNTVKSGVQVLKEIKESLKTDSSLELSEEQATELQKCVSVISTVRTVTTGVSSTTVTSTQNTISSDINGLKNRLNSEYSIITSSLSKVTNEENVKQIVDETVSKYQQYYSETKTKVKSELSQISSTFSSNFEQIVTNCDMQLQSKSTSVLQNILKSRETYDVEEDQTFIETTSYLESRDFISNSCVKNWYNEIEFTSIGENINQKATSELSTLKNRALQSVDQIQTHFDYVLNTIKSGVQVLKQIKEASKTTSNFELSEEQVTQLQKCVSIVRTVESVTTSVSSVTVTNTQQNIVTEVSSLKTQINSEYTKVTSALSTVTDEQQVKQVASESVNIFNQYYSDTRNRVQSQLSQVTSSFFIDFEQITTDTKLPILSESNTNLRDILNSKETYEVEDQSYIEAVSFLKSSSFTSNSCVRNWYKEIESATVSESINEKVSMEFSTLNEKIVQSMDQMQIQSEYVLNSVRSGVQILRDIRKSVKTSSYLELSEEQITELQKSVAIIRAVKTVTTSVSSTVVTNVQKTISSDISNLKNHLNSECTKITGSLVSATNEESVKQVANESVSRYQHYYSETKTKVKSELSQISSTFSSNFEQICTDLSTQNQSKSSSILTNIFKSKTTYDVEEDQTYFEVTSYLKSSEFISSSCVRNWFREIESTASGENNNEKVTRELSALNTRTLQSVDQMQTHSDYVLNTIKNGVQILKQVKEASKSISNFELSQEQIIQLQKCVLMIRTVESVTTSVSSLTVTSTQQNIVSEVSILKTQLNSEYSKVTSTLSTISDEQQVKQVASESVNIFNQYYSDTRDKVQSQLSQVTSSFFVDFEQITTDNVCESNAVLQEILNSKETYDVEDQSYVEAVSYLRSTSFVSDSCVKNWYREVESTMTSESVTEKVSLELSNLNDKISQSVDQMQSQSEYVLNTIKSGIEVIKQIKQSSKTGSFELTHEQIVELQKCISVVKTVKTVSTSVSSNTLVNTQKVISSEINVTKSQLNSELSRVTNSLSIANTEEEVEQIVDESVTKYQQYYASTTNKVQSELSQMSFTFYSNLEQISTRTESEVQRQSIIQNILYSQETYDADDDNDQSYDEVISYLKTSSFTSNSCVQNWFTEIQSTVISQNINEKATSELTSLNNRVVESLDQMQNNSQYILDTMRSGVQVMKQVRESSQNSKLELSQQQILALQKCVSIVQTIKTTATSVSSSSMADVERSMNSDISTLTSQLNSEYSIATSAISMATDENSIKQIASESVIKYGEYYSATRSRVQSRLSQVTSSFYADLEQITFDYSSSSAVLQNVLTQETYEENDQLFADTISFLRSASFTNNNCVQKWFKEIEATSTSESVSEKVTNELSTLNERVSQSATEMQNYSQQVLEIVKNGAQVLKQVRESARSGSTIELSEEQITYLKKCISVVKTIKNVSTKVNSHTVTSTQNAIISGISTLKNQLSSEHSKTISALSSVTNEETVKQIANESVTKYEQYYSQTRNHVQSELSDISSIFYNNFEQISNESEVIQNTINSEEKYEFENDQSYVEAVSYLESSSFTSNSCVENWFKEIESNGTNENINQKVITEVNTLNSRVSQSVDKMQSQLQYVLDIIRNGVQVLKQVRESSKNGSEINLSQEQITYLKKCISVIQIIKSIKSEVHSAAKTNVDTNVSIVQSKEADVDTTTSVMQTDKINTETSSSTVQTEKSVNTNLNNLKSKLNQERSTIENTLRSLNDETTIKQVTSESVNKYDQFYSEARNEVELQLTQSATDFNSNLEQIISNVNQNENDVKVVLQEISSSSNSESIESDTEFNEITTFVSDNLNSEKSVQIWFEEIQSTQTSEASSNEKAITELSALNTRVVESVDNMEVKIQSVLNVLRQGSEIMKRVEESTKQNSKYEFTQEEIIILKKCVIITKTVRTKHTVNSSQTVTENNIRSIPSDNQNDVEYVVNVSKNTKQVVIVESDEDIDEDEIIVQKKQVVNEETVISDVSIDTQTEKNSSHSSAYQHSDSKTIANKSSIAHSKNQKFINQQSSSSKNSSSKTSSQTTNIPPNSPGNQKSIPVTQGSLKELMVNWQVTKSTSSNWPSTCDSLSWDNESYYIQQDDKNLITNVAQLIKVGRAVIEDAINLKKEKLPLYTKVEDIQAILDSSVDYIDEILQQLSSVVGDDFKKWSSAFLTRVARNSFGNVCILQKENGSLDGQFLSMAESFFKLQYTRKTDLLDQIDKQLGNVVCDDVHEARQIAIDKFNMLQSVMKTVLDNIDCLLLKVIDTVINGETAVNCLETVGAADIGESCASVKNAEILCSTISG